MQEKAILLTIKPDLFLVRNGENDEDKYTEVGAKFLSKTLCKHKVQKRWVFPGRH